MGSNKGASEEAIQYHYDLGNSFYAAWLDESMTYSAALWPDDESETVTLMSAQEAKLDHHIDFVKLAEGDRLLDVGCGWGALILRAVERKNLSSALGLTLSKQQNQWISERSRDNRVKSKLCAWQDLNNEEPFSAIISIGAIEHFAKPEMNTDEKMRCYDDFFRFCYENLKDGGRLSIQSITWMNMAPSQEADSSPVHIFPESNLPQVLEIIRSADKYFHLLNYSNRPNDYSKTLREWMKNIRKNESNMIRDYDKEDIQRYLSGFASFILGFRTGMIGLSRLGLLKR